MLGADLIREPSCEWPLVCDPRIGDIVDAIWAGKTPGTEWMRTAQAAAVIQTPQPSSTTLLSARQTSPARAQRTPPAAEARISSGGVSSGGVREHELGGGRPAAGGTRGPFIFNARLGAAEDGRAGAAPDPVNNVDPSGFDVDWTDQSTLSGAAIMGWVAGVGIGTGFSMLAQANPGAAAALGQGIGLGALGTAVNVGVSLLFGSGGSTPARTFTVTPSAAPTSSGTSMQAPQAVAQNGGAVGPGVGPARGAYDAPVPGPIAPVTSELRDRPGVNLYRDPAGAYILSKGARDELQPLFKKFGFDLSRIEVAFASDTVTNGNSAFTVGNSVIINRNSWARLAAVGPKAQRGLLAHEITHSVQYSRFGIFGTEKFLVRYASEYNSTTNYIVPDALKAIPIDALDPIDKRFTLDQIAERVRLEYLGGYP